MGTQSYLGSEVYLSAHQEGPRLDILHRFMAEYPTTIINMP